MEQVRTIDRRGGPLLQANLFAENIYFQVAFQGDAAVRLLEPEEIQSRDKVRLAIAETMKGLLDRVNAEVNQLFQQIPVEDRTPLANNILDARIRYWRDIQSRDDMSYSVAQMAAKRISALTEQKLSLG